MTGRASRRSARKQVVRDGAGRLFDESLGRPISRSQLRDYLADGGFFEARRGDTSVDCTVQVLREVLVDGTVADLFFGGRRSLARLDEPLELLSRLARVAEEWIDGAAGGARPDLRPVPAPGPIGPGGDSPRE